MHGHCNKAMQMQLENDTECKTEIKGDLFAMSEKIKLKMCDQPIKSEMPMHHIV